MPNTNAPVSTRYRGWFHDLVNNTLEAYHGTTRILSASASAITFDLAPTFTGAITAAASTFTGLITAAGGLLSSSATQALGYGTGAGGAVTQMTDATTGVTLSKPCGQITTVALTTAAAAEEAFVVTNTLVDATDVVAVSTTYAGAGTPVVFITNVGAGVFTINISNVHAANALNAVLIINFAVLKTVVA